jgi:hypothetical protein
MRVVLDVEDLARVLKRKRERERESVIGFVTAMCNKVTLRHYGRQ